MTSQLACYWLHKVGGWYGILIRYTRRKHDTGFSIRPVVFVCLYCIHIIYRYIIKARIFLGCSEMHLYALYFWCIHLIFQKFYDKVLYKSSKQVSKTILFILSDSAKPFREKTKILSAIFRYYSLVGKPNDMFYWWIFNRNLRTTELLCNRLVNHYT